jgi:hypothetical protein
LKIRSDIVPTSSPVGTVKHGDRLEILQVHRRFLRVRTPSGVEGWTDERQLLASADMTALRELTERAAKMPSQGLAITYAPLNIHTLPLSASPSFLQLKENEKFDLLQSIVLPRSEAPRKPLIPPVPKKPKVAPPKDTKKSSSVPPPPLPKPPSPPADWMELSKTGHEEDEDQADTKASKAPAPAPPAPKVDGWSLIRTPSGQAGWVLTRLISMAIPDDVAQYAEGRRIVSYFPLGSIQDEDVKKNIWLWTTTADSKQPWDFDSFRVFTWSIKRHRYETGYIERNIHGYLPVLVKDAEVPSKSGSTKNPGFSICMESRDGQRVRREFAMLGQTVRFVGQLACEAAATPPTAQTLSPLPVTTPPPAPPKPHLMDRIKQGWKSLVGGR